MEGEGNAERSAIRQATTALPTLTVAKARNEQTNFTDCCAHAHIVMQPSVTSGSADIDGVLCVVED